VTLPELKFEERLDNYVRKFFVTLVVPGAQFEQAVPQPLFDALVAIQAAATVAARDVNLFYPPKNETENHIYEIRNGRTAEYVMEHVKALKGASK
jgi:hypothetical protein